MLSGIALAIWKVLSGLADTLLGLIAKYPWQALCAALALLSAWSWRGWSHEQAAHRADKAACAARWAQANALAEQKKADAHVVATENTHAHQVLAASELAAADRYKRAHSVVRQAPGVSPAASDRGPEIPPQPATGPLVVEIDTGSFDACTADHIYSIGAYEFIQSLIEKGLAVPAPESQANASRQQPPAVAYLAATHTGSFDDEERQQAHDQPQGGSDAQVPPGRFGDAPQGAERIR